MARWCFCLLTLFVVARFSTAQEPAANRILDRYHSMRPDDAELAMYRLDWADSLEQALERGKTENRPIVLIIIHAKYGDMTSGHC